MSKFKLGDRVVRKPFEYETCFWKEFKKALREPQDYYTVTSTTDRGDIGLDHWENNRPIFLETNFELYEPAVQPEPAQLIDATCTSWDYAEAERLSAEAKAAVRAYNDYISRKPSTYFHPMIEG